MAKFDIKNFLKENKSYCPRAFRDIYADNKGRYRLCCEAEASKPLDKFNLDTHTPFEYFLSEEMEEVRNMMLEGIRLPSCKFCYDIEDRGFESMRHETIYTRNWGEEIVPDLWNADLNNDSPDQIIFDDVRNVHLKLRINGSYCNLSCYMCWPYNSSERRNTLKEIKDWGGYIGEFETGSTNKATKSRTWDEILNDIIENVDKVERIHMTGGEPLQLPRHWQLLDKIPDEHAKNIRLTYDTNLTAIRYKNHTIFDTADKFKRQEFSVSADHYGEKEAWIRYPKDVKDWESKMVEAKDYIGQISLTPSILNGEDLMEIQKYYMDNFGVVAIVSNALFDPFMLSIKNLPQYTKDKLIEKYTVKGSYEWNKVLSELSKPRVEQEYQNGLKYCRELSKRRGDYTKLWPHLT